MARPSGLHICRTISSGHSSFLSSSRSFSSGSSFFAKSFSDFKLSFSVFLLIMGAASLSSRTRQLANLARQFWQEFKKIIDDAHIGGVEDRGVGIFVDGD